MGEPVKGKNLWCVMTQSTAQHRGIHKIPQRESKQGIWFTFGFELFYQELI